MEPGQFIRPQTPALVGFQIVFQIRVGRQLPVRQTAPKWQPSLGDTQFYVSTNSGSNWLRTGSIADSWFCIAGSADGTRLIAGDWYSAIYMSTNSGLSWSVASSVDLGWSSIACSADGSKVVAVAENNGPVYTSLDSGATWQLANAPNANWQSVASSSDGENAVAIGINGNTGIGSIYRSTDAGTTWATDTAPNVNWAAVTSSSDGSKLVGVVRGGGIYAWRTIPSLSISLLSTNALLSWVSNSSSSDFALQQQEFGLGATNWQDVTNIPSLTGGQFQVSVPLSIGRSFFRLSYP